MERIECAGVPTGALGGERNDYSAIVVRKGSNMVLYSDGVIR